jgi:inhibitor of cysteine peptidase
MVRWIKVFTNEGMVRWRDDMKKIMISIFVLCVLGGLVGIYFSAQPKMVGAWSHKAEDNVVLPKGIIKVPFSKELNPDSLDDNLTVTNENGKKVNVSVSLSSDKKMVLIAPPEEGYDSNSDFYKVHFKKGISSINGRSLATDRTILFTVRETLPIVETKEKLDQYFAKIMKEQERSKGFFSFVRNDMKSEEKANSSDSGGAPSHSETNVQVAGIDEGDRVKTNGKHIFQIAENRVNIIKADSPSSMKLDAVISYDHLFSPLEIYVHKDLLIVLGQSYKENAIVKDSMEKKDQILPYRPLQSTTKVIVYNLKNPTQPKNVREIEVEGYLLSSRKMDGKLFFISQHYPDLWILKEEKDVDLRPLFSDSEETSELQHVDYKRIQYMPNSKEANFSLITSVNLENLKQKANIETFLGSGQQVYMSKDHLYFAVPVYHETKDVSLTRGDFDPSPDTTIYKFSVKGMKVEYKASADVSGTVLNQFSMDEHNGFFRVATTKGNTWDDKSPSSNQLFILDENLIQVGKLDHLARGERIYSARFMNDRIYLVTFKEVDPLFVIDAKNPREPKVLGELKIPGFSNYLHPFDENHLIGFGHDTKIVASKESNSEPRVLTNGVKLSFFDVRDVSNPKEKFSEVIGGRGTFSPLHYDHKALLWDKRKGMFGFPISVYHDVEGKEFEQVFEFQGAYVYEVNMEKGFQLKNKITHYTGKTPYEEWEHSIERLVYIHDYLYALSPNTITVHHLTTNEKLGELSLK